MKHIDYAGGEKSMGYYLNSVLPYKRYKKMSATSYFVDKTNILRDLFDCIEEETQYICITRPRRFGKTIMANMIGAFLGKGWDSTDVFDNLYISDESRSILISAVFRKTALPISSISDVFLKV